MGPMNTFPDNRLSGGDPDLPPASGMWQTWSRKEILALFFMVLTGNFFFQYVVYEALGGMFYPVLGGAVFGVFLPLWGISRLRSLQRRRDFGLGPISWPVALTTALMAVASLVPTSLLAEISLRLTPADPASVAFMNENLPRGLWAILAAAVSVVLLAPLAEELIFRGLLHRLVSGLWGPLGGAAISSLVFGILHGEAWILFGLIGVGALLAFIYEATRSITACWVTHAVHNGLSLFLMIRQGPRELEPQPWQWIDLWWGGLSLVCLLALGRFLWTIRRQTEDPV